MKCDRFSDQFLGLIQCTTGRDTARKVWDVGSIASLTAFKYDGMAHHSFLSHARSPACLEDTPQRSGRKIIIRMSRNRYQPQLARVLKLAVATLLAYLLLAIRLNHPNHFPYLQRIPLSYAHNTTPALQHQ
ncbi:hypothetical protein NITHO_6170002 [Nitrolancea hollandica Lb]|uniref:Uncharacterized protein n=1 Tax=Nitrolancea hollandica Lb TaxID=1129897 RepID=I4EML2_9BACT|nr:hypothetical protein NITHO_6170002 [Nitrolancea hollandica Lb]